MTQRVKDLHVSTRQFECAFLEFASHSLEFEQDDRWPETYRDKSAFGLPKDGCTLLDHEGYRVKGAAKILSCQAPVQWPGTGTRHEAALGVAAFLERGIIMIRSSAGQVCIAIASEDGSVVHKLTEH